MDDVYVMMMNYYYWVNHHDQATNQGATANSSQWETDKKKNSAGETSLRRVANPDDWMCQSVTVKYAERKVLSMMPNHEKTRGNKPKS